MWVARPAISALTSCAENAAQTCAPCAMVTPAARTSRSSARPWANWRSAGRGGGGGAGADEGHVVVWRGGPGVGGGGERLQRVGGRARRYGRPDLLAVCHLGQAGALAGHPVDRHQAVEAGAHAAVKTAAFALARVPHLADVAGRQGGPHGLALETINGPAALPEAERPAAGGNGAVSQSGAHGQGAKQKNCLDILYVYVYSSNTSISSSDFYR